MKKIVVAGLFVFLSGSPAWASQYNLDPYFSAAVSSMTVDVGGNQDTAPTFHLAAGSKLDSISPNLAAELRLGFGGQLAAFSGDINSYTSYLIKQSLEISRRLDFFAIAGMTTTSVDIAGLRFSDTGLSYGLGLTYRIPNESITLAGEWMKYHASSDQSTTSVSGMDMSGISVVLSFEYE